MGSKRLAAHLAFQTMAATSSGAVLCLAAFAAAQLEAYQIAVSDVEL